MARGTDGFEVLEMIIIGRGILEGAHYLKGF